MQLAPPWAVRQPCKRHRNRAARQTMNAVLFVHLTAWDTLLIAKVSLGASAVVLNSTAAFTVHRRLQCLNAQDMAGYQRFNRLHERIGIGCVLSIAGAIAVGGYRIAV